MTLVVVNKFLPVHRANRNQIAAKNGSIVILIQVFSDANFGVHTMISEIRKHEQDIRPHQGADALVAGNIATHAVLGSASSPHPAREELENECQWSAIKTRIFPSLRVFMRHNENDHELF